MGSNQPHRPHAGRGLPQPSKVALIFGEYSHPAHPYLNTWADALRQSGLQCSVYSARPEKTPGRNNVRVLTSTSRVEKVGRLAAWSRQWPHPAFDWIIERNEWPLKRKLSTWADFGPLLAERHDVVHLVNSYLYPKFAPLLQRSKNSLIVSFRGYDTVVRPWCDTEWRHTLRDIYRRSGYLHFVSNYLRDEGIALGAPAEKSVVIYPGVDTGFFDPTLVTERRESDVLNLITVGRLTWEKGYVYALHAVRRLIETGYPVMYRIIGSGADQERLTFWVRRLGISSAVTFLGTRSPSEIRASLASSDVYLQPSVSEAIPVAGMEASAMQLPVIATWVGGLGELVENEVTGLLVPPAEPDALAAAVVRLAQDPGERLRLGTSGRKRVLESFALENEIEQWIKLYAASARRECASKIERVPVLQDAPERMLTFD